MIRMVKERTVRGLTQPAPARALDWPQERADALFEEVAE